jgi:hypothetical protein
VRTSPEAVADMGSSVSPSMISSLKRWSANTSRARSLGELVAHERLGLGEDLAHAGLDALEVLGYEGARRPSGPGGSSKS